MLGEDGMEFGRAAAVIEPRSTGKALKASRFSKEGLMDDQFTSLKKKPGKKKPGKIPSLFPPGCQTLQLSNKAVAALENGAG